MFKMQVWRTCIANIQLLSVISNFNTKNLRFHLELLYYLLSHRLVQRGVNVTWET